MKILFLDDMEERHLAFRQMTADRGHYVLHVHSAPGAIAALRHDKFDWAFLDHDLAESHYRAYEEAGEYPAGTGMDVVDAIVGMEEPPQVVVHSWNTDRAGEMVRRLLDAGVTVLRAPFRPGFVSL